MEIEQKNHCKEQGNRESWQDWAPCEMYGHLFHDGFCVDCFEQQY